MLRTEGLVKRYRNRTVIDGFDMEVSEGQIVGLLGPNGAGKTTCFYMVVGLVPCDGGRILLDDQDISTLPMHERARRGLGYLPQEASIFRKLTVAQNIRAVLQLRPDLDRAACDQQLELLLDELKISHLHDQKALSLSGGERRRVEIARALAANPRFILLDEPFAAIDPITVIELQRIVGHLKERGIGVLITDHSVRETLGICDCAYILNDGKVMASGKPMEIIANEQVRDVYLGQDFRL